MEDTREVLDGLLLLHWSVDENRKNASILDRRLPVEGQEGLPLFSALVD
jgi:hypothetical protein